MSDDGPPLVNQGSAKFAAAVTLQMEIVTAGGQRISVPYRLWFWISESKRGKAVRFYAKSYYRGKVTIDNKQYQALIFESHDHDGLFRDSGVWIDLNVDNKFDKAREHFLDDELLQVGAEQYQVVLSHL